VDAALLLRLLLVAALVAGNAFFVATEFALVRVRPTRLREMAGQGHTSALAALRLIDNMDEVISGTQLGITLASLGLGWIGEIALAGLMLPLLEPVLPGRAAVVAHSISLGLAFLGITVLHLVLGEVVPKNVALARADRLAMLVAHPMGLFLHATRPFLRVMDAAAAAVSRLFGAEASRHSHVHSPEEMKMLVTAGRESGFLPAVQEAVIHRVFDLDRVLAREVMVSRPDIVSIPVDTPLDELLRLVLENPYSRIPVYEGSPEKIIGALYVKDLLRVWAQHEKAAGPPREFKLRPLLREVFIVPETKPLNELLEEFRERRKHLALVVDEFGSITGLVTVEDVLEAMVGEIEDEYDVEERPRMSATDASIELEGSTSLLDLENLYGIPLPRDRGFETLAGFVLWRLGAIPQGGESFTYDSWKFTVLGMDRRRVASVRVERAQDSK